MSTPEDDDGWATVPTKKSRNRNNNKPTKHQPTFLPIHVEFIPPTDATLQFQPFMLLLCGLPGSGKSTFARALEQAMPYKFVRINQDELGNRKRCESEARKALADNKCPIIDRCNFDEAQRLKWFEVAQQFEQQQPKQQQRITPNDDTNTTDNTTTNTTSRIVPIPVDCIVFQHTSVEDCIHRCETRGRHETIAPQDAREVVIKVAGQFTRPSREEEATNNIRYRSVKSIPINDTPKLQDILLEYLHRR